MVMALFYCVLHSRHTRRFTESFGVTTPLQQLRHAGTVPHWQIRDVRDKRELETDLRSVVRDPNFH